MLDLHLWKYINYGKRHTRTRGKDRSFCTSVQPKMLGQLQFRIALLKCSRHFYESNSSITKNATRQNHWRCIPEVAEGASVVGLFAASTSCSITHKYCTPYLYTNFLLEKTRRDRKEKKSNVGNEYLVNRGQLSLLWLLHCSIAHRLHQFFGSINQI